MYVLTGLHETCPVAVASSPYNCLSGKKQNAVLRIVVCLLKEHLSYAIKIMV